MLPLELNRNHQQTAFAGSLNALCTIVGWGTLFLRLQEKSLTGNIVIRRGKIRYLRPVFTTEFIAVARPLLAEQVDHFFELLSHQGQSKIDVSVDISDDQGAYVHFTGSYVVQDCSSLCD